MILIIMSELENKERIEKLDKILNAKYLRRGIFAFVFISLATLTGIFIYNKSGDVFGVLKSIDVRYILLGFVFMALDLFLGGLRNHIFSNSFAKGLTLMVAVKANMANMFLGAVTPSQTGGGLAHWYIFWKRGLKTPDFITLSFINFISTTIFFPLSGLMAMYILRDRMPDGFINYLVTFGFFIFSTLGTVIVVALIFPQVIGKIVSVLSVLVVKVRPSLESRLSGFGANATKSMVDYRKSIALFFTIRPWLLLFSLLITIVLYFNKYITAYFLLFAFNVEADFWTIVAIQAVVYLILYFAPTPGGSGIAELSISGLMAGILTKDTSALFILLYRSFLVYIPAVLGAFVMLSELPREKRKPEEVYT